MSIIKITSGEGIELLISGRVDGSVANDLEVEILALINKGVKQIYINLEEANFLCSAGLRVLLQYWRQMKGGGKNLSVTKPSPEVDAVLKMTGYRDQIVEGAKSL